jgi:hypothetical protein
MPLLVPAKILLPLTARALTALLFKEVRVQFEPLLVET